MKSAPLTALVVKLCTYITDLVKMCMWEFNAEKVLFDKMVEFLTWPFYDNCT